MVQIFVRTIFSFWNGINKNLKQNNSGLNMYCIFFSSLSDLMTVTLLLNESH